MKNSYAQALSGFAWLLMISGTIAGIVMISYSTGYGEGSRPFVIPGIGLIFAAIFGGVLYLTIAKISSDLTESRDVSKELISLSTKISGSLSESIEVKKKISLFPIWYQKWGFKVANALFEGKILDGMNKEQIIECLGTPLGSKQSEAVEVFYYDQAVKKLRNLIFVDGVLVGETLSQSIPEIKKINLYATWYKKWGLKVAKALFEDKIFEGMTKEQVVECLGTPLSSEESEIIEVLHYDNPKYTVTQERIKNLIIDNGVIIRWMNSSKALKLGFGLKLGMTQEDVEKEIGDPDKVEEKKIKEHGIKQKFTIHYYDSVLRSKESETTSLKLYFDESSTLVREES